ncbi:MAG: cupin domain-containing protein [Chloroflexota bacterium]|nr:cupin domain-containing protein [Chloroflexota bacterium]
MLVKESVAVPLEAVQAGIGIRWLLRQADGAPNFAMRLIEIEPGVVFKMHQHPYEHEIYVLTGEGVVVGVAGEQRMSPGVALLVLPDELHGYRNVGAETLKFICVIPNP